MTDHETGCDEAGSCYAGCAKVHVNDHGAGCHAGCAPYTP